jgi:hypothetical protein
LEFLLVSYEGGPPIMITINIINDKTKIGKRINNIFVIKRIIQVLVFFANTKSKVGMKNIILSTGNNMIKLDNNPNGKLLPL